MYALVTRKKLSTGVLQSPIMTIYRRTHHDSFVAEQHSVCWCLFDIMMRWGYFKSNSLLSAALKIMSWQTQNGLSSYRHRKFAKSPLHRWSTAPYIQYTLHKMKQIKNKMDKNERRSWVNPKQWMSRPEFLDDGKTQSVRLEVNFRLQALQQQTSYPPFMSLSVMPPNRRALMITDGYCNEYRAHSSIQGLCHGPLDKYLSRWPWLCRVRHQTSKHIISMFCAWQPPVSLAVVQCGWKLARIIYLRYSGLLLPNVMHTLEDKKSVIRAKKYYDRPAIYLEGEVIFFNWVSTCSLQLGITKAGSNREISVELWHRGMRPCSDCTGSSEAYFVAAAGV